MSRSAHTEAQIIAAVKQVVTTPRLAPYEVAVRILSSRAAFLHLREFYPLRQTGFDLVDVLCREASEFAGEL